MSDQQIEKNENGCIDSVAVVTLVIVIVSTAAFWLLGV